VRNPTTLGRTDSSEENSKSFSITREGIRVQGLKGKHEEIQQVIKACGDILY